MRKKFIIENDKVYFINNFINKKSWDEENTNYLEREKKLFYSRLYFWTSYKKSKRAFKFKR